MFWKSNKKPEDFKESEESKRITNAISLPDVKPREFTTETEIHKAAVKLSKSPLLYFVAEQLFENPLLLAILYDRGKQEFEKRRKVYNSEGKEVVD